MTPTDRLKEAITTMPRHLADGEFANQRNIYRQTEYCAIGWLLHCAGVDDNTLLNMDGNIAEPRNMDKVWVLLQTYGLSRMDARYIEETNDHKSREQLEVVLQVILREKEKSEKEREEVA